MGPLTGAGMTGTGKNKQFSYPYPYPRFTRTRTRVGYPNPCSCLSLPEYLRDIVVNFDDPLSPIEIAALSSGGYSTQAANYIDRVRREQEVKERCDALQQQHDLLIAQSLCH